MSNFKTTWSSNKLVNDSSSFWMSDSWFDDTDPLTGEVIEKDNTADLIKLSAYRRAVSNFVNIVTGDNVPVKFSNTDSYTDGKTVWIAAKLDDKNFDANVGLALHEGSHIKYSDFDVLKGLSDRVDKRYGKVDDRWGNKYAPQELKMAVKNIINYIEDRRIDTLVYRSAPGYQGYYQSMYKKYFYSKVIDKALKSSDMRDETWESYEFRLINLHNSNTDLNALKGLRKIYQMIGLGSITRLKDTDEVESLAFQVMDEILKYIPSFDEEDEDGGSQGSDDGDQGEDGDNEMSGGSSEGGSSEGLDFDNPEDGDGGSSDGNADLDSLSDHQKRQLENAVKKQKKFMDGKIQKKKMTKKNLQTMNQLEESGSSLESVEYDNGYGGKKVEVIKVKKLTDSIVKENSLPIISYNKENHLDAVNDGIRLGTLLGKKLQVRSESRTTKYTRQKNGRIDKRLLSELGFNNGGNVFFSTLTDEYNPAILRISIDASGSMGGAKIASAITCATAICKAASMIENLDVVVDMRSTLNSGSGYSRRASNYYPLVVVVYDSRVDKFVKVKKHFPALSSAGTTPEGLCFEAIMDDMVESNRGIDSYFLNFSDGMPMYSDDNVYYSGETAVLQTKKAVQKMTNMGIGILSYFITGNYSSEHELQDFKKMYGSGAENIDVSNVTQVARTMNKLFLDK